MTIVNDGDILAYSNYGSDYVAAVYAYSLSGTVTIENQEGGTILGSAYDGNGYGVDAFGYDDVTVNNAGSIAGSSFNNNATGVNIGSLNGNATVNNTGHIEAYSLTDDARGRIGPVGVRRRGRRQLRQHRRGRLRPGLWRGCVLGLSAPPA